jgi:hypothetical protein
MTAPAIVEKPATDADVLLARMRVAVCRLRLLQADIEEVAVTLKAGRITPRGAMHWLWENDVLELCLTDAEIADTGRAAA